MKIRNARHEVYKFVSKGLAGESSISQDNKYGSGKTVGSVFKDVNFDKHSALIIGKYIIGFSSGGKKSLRLLSFEPSVASDCYDKITYEVIDGSNEPLCLRAIVEAEMPFYAFDRYQDTVEDLGEFTNDQKPQDIKDPETVSQTDFRFVKHGKLLNGEKSIGWVYRDLTIVDLNTAFDNYVVLDRASGFQIVRIIKMKGDKITYEILRSKTAYNSVKKISGYGTYTANVENCTFKAYQRFRDAVQDYNFLVNK